MWIKICANTTLDDALMAAEAGADAVGFVFAPSKRRVVAAQVAAITPHLPSHVEKVGVFATPDAEEIARAATEAGLDTVQLHGGVNLALARAVAAKLPGVQIIPTLSWVVDGGPEQENEATRQLAEVASAPEGYRVLVDSKIGSATGGTGVHFDWGRARGVLKQHNALRLIVAGGLTPENVGEAIAALEPWGVDVASGVEQSAGVKDRAKVEAFIQRARATAR
ncbi:phosphoribosylanthranilate isomerase [Granulicella sp. WH15]|uniref:phosphoribosylanthranilate isomerase n=1 Tax=Granulicella sp. WH15 TaxID=2602070 RepID=UPI001367528A|nr:phosphoribosylanthranilate isomerase [Granulicella sp. WH15]QHN02076.1 phosphoribosylanthranilate isomerase [Granulicella sp. WH15]